MAGRRFTIRSCRSTICQISISVSETVTPADEPLIKWPAGRRASISSSLPAGGDGHRARPAVMTINLPQPRRRATCHRKVGRASLLVATELKRLRRVEFTLLH